MQAWEVRRAHRPPMLVDRAQLLSMERMLPDMSLQLRWGRMSGKPWERCPAPRPPAPIRTAVWDWMTACCGTQLRQG